MIEELAAIRRLIKLLIVVVFISLAIISTAAILATRTASDVKHLAENNRELNKAAFESSKLTGIVLANFSDYLVCLVDPDEELYAKIGKDAYLDQCDKLLFKNTGIEPPPRDKVVDPTTGMTGN